MHGQKTHVERGERGMRHDEVGTELAHHAIQVQQFAHPAVASAREQAGDTRGFQLCANADEIVLLGKQRRNADLMAAALMLNRETLYEYLCPG
ncbi:hypothetical protein GCM10011400_54320 [Paraburkholderia caffeinilytica]|uniref:Uncharacterized protein n=1 Tax=Paraburkholderia caffeinilytica TaxID=1761016 RepID=A0ABQ1N8G0_9BURK|nr:hypothetical protein GCM10011400_54320 [Paraburkholderia caffeinilytica]